MDPLVAQNPEDEEYYDLQEGEDGEDGEDGEQYMPDNQLRAGGRPPMMMVGASASDSDSYGDPDPVARGAQGRIAAHAPQEQGVSRRRYQQESSSSPS